VALSSDAARFAETTKWQKIRLQGQDSPILRASRKLVHEEHLITNYAALRLRFEALDLDLWRDVNHLDLKKLGVPGVLLVPTTTKK